MKTTNCILLDTQTTGFRAPVFVVELAGERMQGYETERVLSRKLLNQNEYIPAEAARVHG